MIDRSHVDRMLFCQYTLAPRSPDPSTKGGCIIYAEYGVSVGVGWNSFPINMKVDDSYYSNRDLKYPRVIHAEMRALLGASDQAFKGQLYCNLPPCSDCAKHICDAGLLEVYIAESGMKSEWARRCSASVQLSMQLFDECSIKVVEVPGV